MDFDDDMDDWDLDGLFDEPEPDDAPGDPDYRATVSGDRLLVVNWMPCLDDGPVTRTLLRAREAAGTTIADLSVSGEPGERDLVVRFLARGGGRAAERRIARWAALTGHRRLWLPDRVVDLPRPRKLGEVATSCPSCGAEWREGDPRFWSSVQAAGLFPSFCLLCGGDLPQWTPAPVRAKVRG